MPISLKLLALLRGNFPLTSIVIKSRFSETWRISPCLRTESADFSSARLLPPFGGFLAVIARIGASATFYLLCRRFGRWSYRSRSAVMPSLCSQYYCNKARRSYCATWAAVWWKYVSIYQYQNMSRIVKYLRWKFRKICDRIFVHNGDYFGGT